MERSEDSNHQMVKIWLDVPPKLLLREVISNIKGKLCSTCDNNQKINLAKTHLKSQVFGQGGENSEQLPVPVSIDTNPFCQKAKDEEEPHLSA